MRHHAATLLVGIACAFGAGCTPPPPAPPIVGEGEREGDVEPPTQPLLPEGMVVTTGETLFSLDTTTPEAYGVVHGGPEGALLSMTLSSAGGRRDIRFRPASGAPVVEVAPPGWNLPPVAAFDDAGRALVCWNELSGPESARGAMPHPSTGLPLVCRVLDGAGLTPRTTAADDAPSWLIDIALVGGRWSVGYFKNQNGWLVGPRVEGDGVFERSFDGTTWGEPVRQDLVP